MRKYLWEKIERARQEPEHVRRRYVFICLAVSMLFIIGIWLLSLKEGLGTVSTGIPEVIKDGKQVIAPDNEPSLNELLNQSAPLRIENESQNGEDFFQTQLEERQKQEQSNNEGVSSPQ